MATPFLATAILGGAQLLGGLIASSNMGPRPRYTMSPEMRRSAGRAEYMAGMGFLPEERAAAIQEGRNQSVGMFRRSMDAAGGNLARSLFAAQGADNLEFQNRLASQDANLRRGNIRYADTFSREAQRLQDANTSSDLNFRMQEEKALGGAIQQGTTNIVNAFNQGQLMKMYEKLYSQGYGGGMFGGVPAGNYGLKGQVIPVNASGTVGVMDDGGFSVNEYGAYPNYPQFTGSGIYINPFANPFYSFGSNFLPK